ncbi:MAG: sulfurtransferase [Alphaproteobacteria bacterium HGW-Alphaproteobacteria-5]|nr:MAG: sulfurtransferase [Alphaproteobacteria bacterium HGW-Alphaproteobacteria-5]
MLKKLTIALALVVAAFWGALAPALADGLPGPLVSAEWLRENLDRADLVVVDVRGKTAGEEFAAGHMPGAVFSAYPGAWRGQGDIAGAVPEISALEATIAALGVNSDSLVVIVPAGTNSTEFGGAARLYWSFKYAGHDGVAILDGGWPAWVADAANPVATGVADVARGNFAATVRPEILATTEQVEAALAAGIPLIDARPAEQYAGTKKAGAAKRAGHIPGAVSLDNAVFYDASTNRIKPLDELRALVPVALGGDTGVQAITYCNAGHWSATDWFVLHELLGYENLALYVDSMIGWTQDDARPVATN